nr:unnamed protein product [Callosobruchus chinensis]
MEYNAEVEYDTVSDTSGSENKGDKAHSKRNRKSRVNFPENRKEVKKNDAQTIGHPRNGKSIKTNVLDSDDGMCTDAVGSFEVDLELKALKKIKVIRKSRSNDVSSLSEEQSVKCFIDVPDYSLVGIDGGYQDPF